MRQPDNKVLLADIPWAEIMGMRNRLVHGYASVDHDVVSAVVTEDLPALVAALERDGSAG